MSDEQPGGIRRVTRKGRRRRIEPGRLEFPTDDLAYAPPDSTEPQAQPPAEAPDTDATIEAAAVETAPPAERFPPLEFTAETKPPPAKLRRQPAPPRRRGSCLFNLISLLFLLASCAAVAWIALVWTNPYTPLNPLAPFTPLPVYITTTPLPPTPTLPSSPAPTDSLGPTATFTPLALVQTRSPFAFVLAETGAVYVANGGGQECAWASIAGSVTDSAGSPLTDYQIRVEGAGFAPQPVRSGAAPAYGAGGYEMPLGDAPVEGVYTVQLLDPGGSPVSDTYTIVTRAGCDGNVAVVNFIGQP